jgi:hypothetical protein
MSDRRISSALVVGALALAACTGEGMPAPSVPHGTRSTAPTPVIGSSVLAITCDGASAGLSETAVRAMSDGVHLDAFAPDGSLATVDVSEEADGSVATIRGAAALALAPGPYRLACLDATARAGLAVTAVVTDPDGLWKPANISCPGGGGVTGSDGATPASPEAALAYLRTVVPLRPGDVIELAGYPSAPSGRIRLVRDGQVIASWVVVLGEGGTLAIASYQHCPERPVPTESPAATPRAIAPPLASTLA